MPLVDTVSFELHSYFQNLTLLVIRIEPSPEFHARFQKVCEQHCAEMTVYNWRSFFFKSTFWRCSTEQASKVKNELFEGLLRSLRGDVAKYLDEYFSGYFTQNDAPIPSFELYLFNESVQSPAARHPSATITPASPIGPPTKSVDTDNFTTLDLSTPTPAFWESLEMDRNHMAFADESRTAFIFDPFLLEPRGRGVRAIKILIDKSKITKEAGYASLESQIIYCVSRWVLGLSPLWVLQSVLFCIQERLPDYRDAVFQYANSWRVWWWPFLSQMAKAKLRLNADWFTFERLRNDFRLRDVQFDLTAIRGVPPFTWTHGVFRGEPKTEEFSSVMISRVRGHIHETRKMFTTINFAFAEILQVNVIRSNYWLQAIMLLVAIAALAVSGVTFWVELVRRGPLP
ncbi:MAG: hypothetical protein HKL90_01725 [Elusimicrobia bacterium]|nr:hypothetical protein [Elusimicrobiota bacterium]